jgi:hypothetical protein
MRTAEIIPVEAVYFAAARRTRSVAMMLREARRFGEALILNAEARRLDGIAYCIQAKADALARAEVRNRAAEYFGVSPDVVVVGVDQAATP